MQSNPTKKAKILGILILCILPAAYLYLIAEDRYQSISHFSVVVEESNNVEASMGLLDMVTGASTVSNDAQTAIGFIGSSDLLFELETEFNLIEHYTAPPIDFIFRLEGDASKNERINYYREKISAEIDAYSGLIYLTVESFSPELSEKLSDYILLKTEEFVLTLIHY